MSGGSQSMFARTSEVASQMLETASGIILVEMKYRYSEHYCA
jgi:hypothetical protein